MMVTAAAGCNGQRGTHTQQLHRNRVLGQQAFIELFLKIHIQTSLTQNCDAGRAAHRLLVCFHFFAASFFGAPNLVGLPMRSSRTTQQFMIRMA